jgi:hypothetical protein
VRRRRRPREPRATASQGAVALFAPFRLLGARPRPRGAQRPRARARALGERRDDAVVGGGHRQDGRHSAVHVALPAVKAGAPDHAHARPGGLRRAPARRADGESRRTASRAGMFSAAGRGGAAYATSSARAARGGRAAGRGAACPGGLLFYAHPAPTRYAGAPVDAVPPERRVAAQPRHAQRRGRRQRGRVGSRLGAGRRDVVEIKGGIPGVELDRPAAGGALPAPDRVEITHVQQPSVLQVGVPLVQWAGGETGEWCQVGGQGAPFGVLGSGERGCVAPA